MIRLTFALIALACTAPAFAQDCAALKQIASVETHSPGKSSVMLADAGFNGTPRPMLVNTGAGISTIRENAMEPLGLHGIRNSNIKLLGGGGGASQSFTEVADFTLGAIHVPRAQCHVLYWHPTGLAVLPIQTQLATGDSSRTGFRSYVYRSHSIYVPVTLDGKDLQAQIDTGSSVSTMNANTAKFIFGVTADSPGSVAQGAADGDPAHARFSHVFSTLTFDGVTVTNARFEIYPDLIGAHDPNNTNRTDTRVKRIDDNLTAGNHISIGMDVLRRLRLFVAFSENKLYVTPATAPVVAAAPASQ